MPVVLRRVIIGACEKWVIAYHLTANFTENFAKFQQDLARVIKRWPSLLPNIQAAIMVLIGGDDE